MKLDKILEIAGIDRKLVKESLEQGDSTYKYENTKLFHEIQKDPLFHNKRTAWMHYIDKYNADVMRICLRFALYELERKGDNRLFVYALKYFLTFPSDGNMPEINDGLDYMFNQLDIGIRKKAFEGFKWNSIYYRLITTLEQAKEYLQKYGNGMLFSDKS